MKRFIATATLALCASSAQASDDFSYSETFQVLKDIRNTMTRYCDYHGAQLPNSNASLFERCGQAFNGEVIHGATFYFDRAYDRANLTTRTRWTFVFEYPSRRDAFLFHFIEDRLHQSILRDRTKDKVRPFMEVEYADTSTGTPQFQRLTNGQAWRGHLAGDDPKGPDNTPAISDYRLGLDLALRTLRNYRWKIRESYHVN